MGRPNEKELLVGILTELQQIRLTLQDTQTPEPVDEYICKRCGKTVAESDRKKHAETHNYPTDHAGQLFKRVTE